MGFCICKCCYGFQLSDVSPIFFDTEGGRFRLFVCSGFEFFEYS